MQRPYLRLPDAFAVLPSRGKKGHRGLNDALRSAATIVGKRHVYTTKGIMHLTQGRKAAETCHGRRKDQAESSAGFQERCAPMNEQTVQRAISLKRRTQRGEVPLEIVGKGVSRDA